MVNNAKCQYPVSLFGAGRLGLLGHTVQLLRRQARFGNHVLAASWEAIVKHVGVAKTDHVPDLIPEAIGVENILGAELYFYNSVL